jgi:hypothetical protein
MFLEYSIDIQFSRFRSDTENAGFWLSHAFHNLILHLYYTDVKRLGKIFLFLAETLAKRATAG